MITQRKPHFYSTRYAQALPVHSGQRALFFLWHAAVLLGSSAVFSMLSLLLSFGNYDWGVFVGYFAAPQIILLNTLPVLLLELLLFFVLGRMGFAALFTALVVLLSSAGNYFKIAFRFEPFVFRDIDAVSAGLKIVSNYHLFWNNRLVIVVVVGLLCVAACFLLARGQFRWRSRVAGALLVVLSLFPLWRYVYSDRDIYYRVSHANSYLGNVTAQNNYICAGFVYPFLFSITDRQDIKPDGYDVEEARTLHSAYEDATIPEDRRVNILVYQLESFCDLEAQGLSGIDPAVYAPLRVLEEETLHGILFSNTFGGGTIDSERCFLTGSYGMQTYTRSAPSYARYLSEQGYFVTGCHPNVPDFYNRLNVMRYLGMERFDLIGTAGSPVTQAWQRDEVFFPETIRVFREALQGEQPVFSFNISMQGHSPYSDDTPETLFWQGEGVSAGCLNTVNHYLASVAETQQMLSAALDELRGETEPVVVLFYGDHCPFLNNYNYYSELGLNQLDKSTPEELVAYYGTPWLLWANDAAKPYLAQELSGEGGILSPGYLMSLVFDALGWEGSAFMQFTRSVRELLPVVSSNGYVLENGVLSDSPSETALELLHQYAELQFYLRDSYPR